MTFHATGHTGDAKKDAKGFDADLVECGEHEGSTCMVTNPKWKNKKYPFTLLATDYDNYYVYYFCFPVPYSANALNFQMVIIGSRTRALPTGQKLEEVKQAIRSQLPDYDLDTYTGYSPNIQEDWCEYDWKYDSYTDATQ